MLAAFRASESVRIRLSGGLLGKLAFDQIVN
jgi:hypothetical protein